MGKMMDAYRVVVGKLVRKRKLGRPRHMWEYKVKMECEEREGTWTITICLRIRTGGGRL
jgi:hypothetical protein